MTRTTSRKARVGRACDDCSAWIAPGEKYLEHVAAPDHNDLGNTHWWRIRECSRCAVRYGRGHLFTVVAS